MQHENLLLRRICVLMIFTVPVDTYERKFTHGRLIIQSKNRKKRNIQWSHLVKWRISALRKNKGCLHAKLKKK